MAKTLEGMKIAILAADGVGQVELEIPREAVRQAGAETELLSLHTGQIQTYQNDFDSAHTYTVDRAVARATVDDYDAVLLVRGMVNPEKLCSDDIVVSFVHEFIGSGKPVGVVCHGAWTVVEAGVARGRSLRSHPNMRAYRKTGASIVESNGISPDELRPFYTTIVDEFARIPQRALTERRPEIGQHSIPAGGVATAAGF